MMSVSHEYYMQQALDLARAAKGEVPIAAVLVMDGAIIASASNAPIGDCDPTAHAEINVMRVAAKKISNYRLVGATLYVTLEPCMMCFGAMVHARIAHLVYGASDPKVGFISTGVKDQVKGLNHEMALTGGVMAEDCGALLKAFFQQRR